MTTDHAMFFARAVSIDLGSALALTEEPQGVGRGPRKMAVVPCSGGSNGTYIPKIGMGWHGLAENLVGRTPNVMVILVMR